MDLVWLKNTGRGARIVEGKWLEPGDCRQLVCGQAEKAVKRGGGVLIIIDEPANEPANFTTAPADQHVGNYRGPHR